MLDTRMTLRIPFENNHETSSIFYSVGGLILYPFNKRVEEEKSLWFPDSDYVEVVIVPVAHVLPIRSGHRPVAL